ncbi:tRNA pseudouridine(38-40) synthase TruA [Synoicihabitans lomoniglobus]|uniref:tRNA pseudouridine synthase A n=1 Tax=Synoicihabitans lomoniglobus TaxID=2909285 RepID=A0AAF0CQR2_9BACT|nr:tRNA pseudouridine(38-40) synthase TruA [Opitutaceae bacterium LMO-M01]WED66318.1 tRNA pseudouridine(38-40) synthase TruA [Opitutaceae bacterium LMO-M01]
MVPPTRWRGVCAYDGTAFSGWQSQSNGKGVQDVIEARLAEILKTPVRLHGSGRTDAGVHALGQVFHFDAAWRHGPDRLRAALRAGLPPTIQIKSASVVAADFHARFSAIGKRYSFRIFEGDADPFLRPFVWSLERPRRLDGGAMKEAAAVLRGRHNFLPFAADNGTELEDPVRDLRRLDITARGRHLKLVFEANGFLYKMVRSLTGALVAVGEGRLTVADISRLVESGAPRTAEVETAPPQGLFLEKVFY